MYAFGPPNSETFPRSSKSLPVETFWRVGHVETLGKLRYVETFGGFRLYVETFWHAATRQGGKMEGETSCCAPEQRRGNVWRTQNVSTSPPAPLERISRAPGLPCALKRFHVAKRFQTPWKRFTVETFCGIGPENVLLRTHPSTWKRFGGRGRRRRGHKNVSTSRTAENVSTWRHPRTFRRRQRFDVTK